MNARVRESINAMVVGVGRFGKHHARILSQLNRRNQSNIPRIDRLIVSCTGMDQARQAAAALKRDHRIAVSDIVPTVIRDVSDFNNVLSTYSPRFIAITARDKTKGDAIHADYALTAIKHGGVLCEKPFSSADGNGSSLIPLEKLMTSPHANGFGLELPMAVVFNELKLLPEIYQRLSNTRSIRFYWHGPTRTNLELVDDLALHPWSLLPEDLEARIIEVVSESKRAVIRLQLRYPESHRHTDCLMTLYRGGTFRAIECRDLTVSFRINAGNVDIIQLPTTPNQHSADNETREVLLRTVENPLEHHIISVLRQKPIVGLERTYRSQYFLEALHGYTRKDAFFRLT